jgi:hypothetical protein
LKSRLQHTASDRPQHDRPAACVIAQQYSFATFVSMCFHSRKEKFGARFKLYFIFNIFKIAQFEIA